MTGRTDIDQALTEWGRDARARAAATAPAPPRIADQLPEHRSTALRWWAVAAAVILTAAVGGTVGVISARHSDHHVAGHRTPEPAVTVPCELAFGASSVSFTPGGTNTLAVRLTYRGHSDCLLGSGPPGLLLVSAHGATFGSLQELARLGGYHPPRSSRTVRVRPGDTVSFQVRGFHDCLPTPSDSYTLRVALDRSVPPTSTGGLAVPIGHLEPSGLLCLTAGLGATTPVTVSPAAPTTRSSALVGLGDHRWRLTSYDAAGVKGTPRQVETLQFAPDNTFSGSDDCNDFAGKAAIAANTMNLQITSSTAVACGGHFAVANVLYGKVAWTISGNELTITRPGTGVLTYTAMG